MEIALSEISVSYHPAVPPSLEIRSSKDAYSVFKNLVSPDTIQLKEESICLYLNRANKVLGWYKVSSGGLTGTVVDIRLILGIALKSASANIILCHNHPSGSPKPSSADRELTDKLKRAALIMDINLLDHLIITDHGYMSFGDEGLI